MGNRGEQIILKSISYTVFASVYYGIYVSSICFLQQPAQQNNIKTIINMIIYRASFYLRLCLKQTVHEMLFILKLWSLFDPKLEFKCWKFILGSKYSTT